MDGEPVRFSHGSGVAGRNERLGGGGGGADWFDFANVEGRMEEAGFVFANVEGRMAEAGECGLQRGERGAVQSESGMGGGLEWANRAVGACAEVKECLFSMNGEFDRINMIEGISGLEDWMYRVT